MVQLSRWTTGLRQVIPASRTVLHMRSTSGTSADCGVAAAIRLHAQHPLEEG